MTIAELVNMLSECPPHGEVMIDLGADNTSPQQLFDIGEVMIFDNNLILEIDYSSEESIALGIAEKP